MLFYRALLAGEVAAVVSLSAGAVLPHRALGLPGGKVRVTVRYALRCGSVRLHRGWLSTDLAVGTRLQVVGYQVGGCELLVSLRPLPPARGGPERLDDQFRLPFRIQSWGVEAIQGAAVSLSLSCSARPGSLLLRGRLVLRLETPAARFRRVIPFCRLVLAKLSQGLDWRAYGGMVGLSCRVRSGGEVEGEAHLAFTCLGLPYRGAETSALPPAAAVREVTAQVTRLGAEVLWMDRVLLHGVLELETAWADRSGQSRWTGQEQPFSALLSLPGLSEGDRLEPVAQIDRLTRVGQGQQERALVEVALGLTGLRLVHLPMEGGWYRAEQVVGQAVESLTLDQPLFVQPDPRPHPEPASQVQEIPWEAGLEPGWGALRANLRLHPGTGERWKGAISLAVDGAPGEGRRFTLPFTGSLADGGRGLQAGLEAVGPRSAQVRVRQLPWNGSGANLSPGAWQGESTDEVAGLPGPAAAMLELAALADRSAWAARCLVRCGPARQAVTVRLHPPGESRGSEVEPVAITAYGFAHEDELPEQMRVQVVWRRCTG